MSTPTHDAIQLAHIRALVETFDVDLPGSGEVRYFLSPDREAFARHLGDLFWLPVERTYTAFCYAYGALFGIPAFTREALARQHDRFSKKRLPLTIRSTSGFVLDGFGYDRRAERARKDIYWPGPVIKTVHADQSKHGKVRISNPAMAYFGYHLIRAAERLSPHTSETDRNDHFLYVGDFFRTAGYPFPGDRARAEAFSHQADQTLSGNAYADLWRNVQSAARDLNAAFDPKAFAAFLPERTAGFFAQTML